MENNLVVRGLSEMLGKTISVLSVDPTNNTSTKLVFTPSKINNRTVLHIGHIKDKHFVPLKCKESVYGNLFKRKKTSTQSDMLGFFARKKKTPDNTASTSREYVAASLASEHDQGDVEVGLQTDQMESSQSEASAMLPNESQQPQPDQVHSDVATNTASQSQEANIGLNIASWDIADVVNLDLPLNDSKKLEIITNANKLKPSWKFKFPPTTFGRQQRAFRFEWLQTYHHLTYSKKLDAVFCLPCVLFTAGAERGTLSTKPYKNWKDAKEKFEAHFNGVQAKTKGGSGKAMHDTCVEKMKLFTATMQRQEDVIQQITNQQRENIIRNRKILNSISQTVRFCGIQGLALRNANENNKDPDVNHGNFKELLKFRMDSGDSVLSYHFETARRNALYTSKTVQNEIIDIFGTFVQQEIVQDIGEGCYSINADEVQDSSNKEQLALCVRYTDRQRKIAEKLLQFVDVTADTSGENLAKEIKATLIKAGLNLSKLRGQCYDGAGNMAGRTKGVGPRIQAEYPRAVHVWCANHKLNLVIVCSCKEPAIRNMQDSTDQCVRFFTNSPKREDCLNETMKESGKEPKKLKELCKVRWIERHIAYNRFLELYEPIVMALETIERGQRFNRASANEAATLVAAITKFEYICALVLTCQILSYLEPLSKFLQSRSLHLQKALHAIGLAKTSLLEVRANADRYGEEWFRKSVEIAAKVNVLPTMPRIVRRQTLRVNAPAATPEAHFKRNILIPFVDHVNQEMDTRFTNDLEGQLVGMVLLPKFLTPQVRAAKFTQYADDMPFPEDLDAEIHLWKTHWNTQGNTDTVDLEDALVYASEADMYPNITAILCLMAVLPVTSCESERSFNQMKLLKTCIRNRMSEERLNGLALMKVHRKITNALDIEKVVDKFAQLHPRKMDLENIFAE